MCRPCRHDPSDFFEHAVLERHLCDDFLELAVFGPQGGCRARQPHSIVSFSEPFGVRVLLTGYKRLNQPILRAIQSGIVADRSMSPNAMA